MSILNGHATGWVIINVQLFGEIDANGGTGLDVNRIKLQGLAVTNPGSG